MKVYYIDVWVVYTGCNNKNYSTKINTQIEAENMQSAIQEALKKCEMGYPYEIRKFYVKEIYEKDPNFDYEAYKERKKQQKKQKKITW